IEERTVLFISKQEHENQLAASNNPSSNSSFDSSTEHH
ncbi:unnamed protein product, partial [Rotaria sp. Silwood1]